jgi:hypothetical protein
MAASLVDGLRQLSPEEEEIQQMHEQLKAVRSPSLDGLRTSVKQMPTSALIGALVFIPHQPPLTEEEMQLPVEAINLIVMAMSAEIGEEIDRRMPVPK